MIKDEKAHKTQKYCGCNCHCVVDKLLKFRTDGFSTRGLYGSIYARILIK